MLSFIVTVLNILESLIDRFMLSSIVLCLVLDQSACLYIIQSGSGTEDCQRFMRQRSLERFTSQHIHVFTSEVICMEQCQIK